MKNRQYTMEDFRRGGLAVAIRRSKERDKLLRLCEENGIMWNNGEKATEFHPPQAYPYAIVCGDSHNGRLTWRGSLRGAMSLAQITDSPAPHHHYRVEIDCADGKTTVARLLVDGREVKRREARCNPADTFSLRKGAELAFARLWDKKVKPGKKPAVCEVIRHARVGDTSCWKGTSRERGAEPVRHGQWEWYEDPITSLFPDPDYGWRCSQCKEDAEAIIQRASPTANVFFDDSNVPPKLDYCPNCGAKMDKEDGA